MLFYQSLTAGFSAKEAATRLSAMESMEIGLSVRFGSKDSGNPGYETQQGPDPVKRFSLGRFCPNRFGRDVHPG